MMDGDAMVDTNRDAPRPVPDFPRLPIGYALRSLDSLSSLSRALPSDGTWTDSRHQRLDWQQHEAFHWTELFTVATALVLACHSGEDEVSFDVVGDGAPRRLDMPVGRSAMIPSILHGRRQSDALGQSRVLLAFCDVRGDRPRFPLAFQVRDQTEFNVLFDPAVVDSRLAPWLVDHFCAAICTLASSHWTDFRIDSISLVSPTERDEILRLACDVRAEAAQSDAYLGCETLHSIILQTAKDFPHATAISWLDPDSAASSAAFDISFSQLASLSLSFALTLVQHPALRPFYPSMRRVVAVTADKHPLILFVLLAILRAGAAYVFIEPDTPDERKREMLRLCDAAVVVVADDGATSDQIDVWSEGLPVLRAAHILRAELDALHHCQPLPPLAQDPPSLPSIASDATAYCIFTSGSSGRPKGIAVSHKNLVSFLRNYRGRFQRCGVGERVLQFPSFAFDVVVMNVWDTLAHGSTVCMTSRTALHSDLPSCIASLRVTSTDLTPTVAALLLEHVSLSSAAFQTPREAWLASNLASFRHLNTGAEAVPSWLRRAFLETGISVLVDYGPSETTVGVISSLCLPDPDPLSPKEVTDIGRPTGRNKVYLLGESGELVPLGGIGEICVAGNQVTSGYLDSTLDEGVFGYFTPDSSKPEVKERIYRTGDLGRYLSDGSEGYGSIECLGRRDLQVKISGLRIEIGEIEHRLNNEDKLVEGVRGIRTAVVDKLEREDMPTGLIAFVELQPLNASSRPSSSSSIPVEVADIDDPASFSHLISAAERSLARSLPSYMIPRYWLPVSRMPMQISGKTDRKSLRRLAQFYDFRRGTTVPDAGRPGQWMKDEADRAVASAWAKVLGVDEASLKPDDEFVRLGGDSIGFIRVAATLRAQGFHTPFVALMGAKTLANCAAALRSASTEGWVNGYTPHQYEPFGLLDGKKEEAFSELQAQLGIRPEDIEDVLPTAPPQDAILAASLDSDMYYSQAVYPLHLSSVAGTTPQKVAKALEELMRSRAMMRTGFAVLESVQATVQIVFTVESAEVKTKGACKVDEVSSDAEMDQNVQDFLASDRAKRSFAWGRLHLTLHVFSSRESGRAKLVWGMHHAQSDGWALELLMTDLGKLCASHGALERRPPYGDFVRWWRSDEADEADEKVQRQAFWQKYLGNVPHVDWPRDSCVTRLHGFETSHFVSRVWHGRLASLAATHGVTPAIASRVAAAIALASASGSLEVVFGTVRSGRDVDLPGAADMAGCCVSALPSRFQLDANLTLLEIMKQESSTDKAIRTHQRVTLSELSQLASSGQRDLFRILLTFQSLAQRTDEDVATLPVRQPPEWIKMPSNYALSLEITPLENDKLELAAFFDVRSLQPCEVDEVLRAFEQVMTIICEDARASVHSVIGSLLKDSTTTKPSSMFANGTTYVNGTNGNGHVHLHLADDGDAFVDHLRAAWRSALRFKPALVPIDVPFGALGGDSIAIMRLSALLKKSNLAIPLSQLTRLPTIHDQAAWLAFRN